MHHLVFRPRLRAAEPGNDPVALLTDIRAQKKIPVHEVNEDGRRLSFTSGTPEGIAVHSGSGAGSQFRQDVPAVQQHRVIPSRSFLPLMGESGLIPLPVQRIRLVSHDGHQQHIPVVEDTRTAQMGMTETYNGVIRIMVAGAALPGINPGVGTQLHHPERSRRSRESMAGEVRADHRVHIIHESPVFLRAGANSHCYSSHNQDGENLPHFLLKFL